MSGSKSSALGDSLSSKPVAPTEPVSLTVHGVVLPDAAALERRTRAGRWKMLLVLAVCAAPVLASYVTYFVIRPQARTNYAALIQPTRGIPAGLGLQRLTGQPVASAELRRQWLLVSVTGSQCDTACEQRLLMQRQLHLMLGKERERVDKLWLVVDDAVPHAGLLSAQTSGADPATVLRVPRAALAQWLQPAAGQALEDHLYIVDPMGEWMMRAPVQPEAQRLKKDLDRLLRASASWDAAGR